MDQREIDIGTLTAVIERFQKWRYPEAQRLKKRLDAGEAPNEIDVDFVQTCLREVQEVRPIVARNADYEHLLKEVIELFDSLAERVLK